MMKKIIFFLFALNCFQSVFAQHNLWKVMDNSFINSKGEIVLKTNFESVSEFKEGLAIFYRDSTHIKSGYVNTNGKVVFNKTNQLYPFNEGLAPYFKKGFISHLLQITNSCTDCNINSVYKTGKLIFLNKKGRKVFTFKYNNYIYGRMYPTDFAVPFFSEGLAVVSIVNKDTSSWHNFIFIDQKGKRAFNTNFLFAKNFSEGLALVTTLNGETGYINFKGQMVIKLNYPILYGTDFSENFAVVADTSNKEYYINKKGERLGNLYFRRAEPFSDGMAKVEVNKKYGYIDSTGIIKIETNYIEATDFSNGTAPVVEYKKTSSGYLRNTFLINKKGEKLSSDLGDVHILKFRDGLAYGTQRGQNTNVIIEFYINTHGEMIWKNTPAGAECVLNKSTN